MKKYVEVTSLMDELNEAQIETDDTYKGLAKAKYIVSTHPYTTDEEIKKSTYAVWDISCDGYYPYCTKCFSEPRGRKITPYCGECGAKMTNFNDFDKENIHGIR